ncbi:hypothetical protein POM88_050026 [Heracleum sosnowskyi]|uniref:Uncharacterized protein n=1 Tax=Heracleum sosnowskyi TaxID=360622 RepID=A0AAD8GZB9_9APIA|nr:hypothetical protein POM88_050026 [Heracleum sosnowskyi]
MLLYIADVSTKDPPSNLPHLQLRHQLGFSFGLFSFKWRIERRMRKTRELFAVFSSCPIIADVLSARAWYAPPLLFFVYPLFSFQFLCGPGTQSFRGRLEGLALQLIWILERTRPLPRLRSFGNPRIVPLDIIKERILQWRRSLLV